MEIVVFVFPLQVEITLQDVNDNPPVFPNDILDVTIEENVGDGFKIMQLTATDADEVIAPQVSTLTVFLHFSLTAFRIDILGKYVLIFSPAVPEVSSDLH